MIMVINNSCVCCGKEIPEGEMVCSYCTATVNPRELMYKYAMVEARRKQEEKKRKAMEEEENLWKFPILTEYRTKKSIKYGIIAAILPWVIVVLGVIVFITLILP